MALTPGTKLGQYEITGAIGAVGMGEVYRGRDTRLGWDVAIKCFQKFSRTTARVASGSSVRQSFSLR